MGFRFRRSIRLGKGLRINLSKRGASLSVGRRGATVNFGPKGEKLTVGLPGTGLSYSQRIGQPAATERRSQAKPIQLEEPAPLPLDQSSELSLVLPWLVVLAVLIGVVIGAYAAATTLAHP